MRVEEKINEKRGEEMRNKGMEGKERKGNERKIELWMSLTSVFVSSWGVWVYLPLERLIWNQQHSAHLCQPTGSWEYRGIAGRTFWESLRRMEHWERGSGLSQEGWDGYMDRSNDLRREGKTRV